MAEPLPPDDGPAFADAGDLPDGLTLRDAAGQTPDTAVLDENGELCLTGRLASTLCDPAGGALVDAEVLIETRTCDGRATTISVRTDERGAFRVADLRAGLTRVRIQSGRFTAQYEVEIRANADATLSPTGSTKVCLEPDAVGLAVLTGQYDRIEQVLGDLGFDYDLHCGDDGAHRGGRALIDDPALLGSYEVLFVNCGSGIDLRATNPETQALVENLRGFVAAGGSVYVSDLAADFVGAVWPDAVEFAAQTRDPAMADQCCVCVDCSAECEGPPRATRCGESTTQPAACSGGAGVRGFGRVGRLEARIIDDRLAALFGDRTVNLDFDLPGWVEVESVAAGVDVLVEADTADGPRPMIVAFTPVEGGGRVVFTSFHNDDQASDDIRRLLSALVFEL